MKRKEQREKRTRRHGRNLVSEDISRCAVD